MQVAEYGEGEGSKIRQVDAADPFQEEAAVVEAASFFVWKGEDKTAEQEEENDGLMSGDEQPQGGAIDDVDDWRRAEPEEVVEDDGQCGQASQGIQFVEAPGIALLGQVFRN